MSDDEVIAALEDREDELIRLQRRLLDRGRHAAAAAVERDLEGVQAALVVLVLR